MVTARHSVGRVLTQAQNSLYVCRSCKHRLTRMQIATRQQRFASNEQIQSAERSRRQMQGDDYLTSLKNPYGGHSPVERGSDPRRSEPNAIVRRAQSDQTITGRSSDGSMVPTRADKYVPAKNWQDLRHVGYSEKQNWRNAPFTESDVFSPWLESTSAITLDRTQLVSCLHQAVIECLACKQADLNPSNTIYLDSRQYSTGASDAFSATKIEVSPLGTPGQVQFATETHAKEIVEVLASVDEAVNNHEIRATELESESDQEVELESGERDQELQLGTDSIALTSRYNVQDESFLRLRLSVDEPVTFHILKRFSQLSGHRIPDHILNTAFSSNKPLSFLIDQIHDQVVQPKPKKIAEILMNKPGLSDQSNVMIFPRRETPVDKEKELGRWKVIEKELQDRGLPAFGRPSLQNN